MSKEHNLSEDRVKTILAAGILRYLQGRTQLSFVTELAAELSENHDFAFHGDLLEIISQLNFLGYQSKYVNISPAAINEKLSKILERLHVSQIPYKN